MMRKVVRQKKLTRKQLGFAIGDIHGCYQELLWLEEKIYAACERSGASRPYIVSVGDLYDRGPDSKMVMEHFCRGREAGTHDLVIGNHEIYMLMALMGLRPDLIINADVELQWVHHFLATMFDHLLTTTDYWLRTGGGPTIQSYGADIKKPKTWTKIPEHHIRLLFDSPLVIRLPGIVISHALLQVGDLEVLTACNEPNWKKLNNMDVEASIMRCLWSRDLPERILAPRTRHVSGHSPYETVQRNAKLQTIQIDTGAVYGVDLTALNLSTFRAIKVPSKFKYRGRD